MSRTYREKSYGGAIDIDSSHLEIERRLYRVPDAFSRPLSTADGAQEVSVIGSRELGFPDDHRRLLTAAFVRVLNTIWALSGDNRGDALRFGDIAKYGADSQPVQSFEVSDVMHSTTFNRVVDALGHIGESHIGQPIVERVRLDEKLDGKLRGTGARVGYRVPPEVFFTDKRQN